MSSETNFSWSGFKIKVSAKSGPRHQKGWEALTYSTPVVLKVFEVMYPLGNILSIKYHLTVITSIILQMQLNYRDTFTLRFHYEKNSCTPRSTFAFYHLRTTVLHSYYTRSGATSLRQAGANYSSPLGKIHFQFPLLANDVILLNQPWQDLFKHKQPHSLCSLYIVNLPVRPRQGPFQNPSTQQTLSSRGDMVSLTRVGTMTIGYFSPPSERVLLWFWQWSWDCFLVAHMCFKGAMAVKSMFVD